jgi:hypothetical protein
MPSSPNLIFIFLKRGLKKSEYSSNSKLHDFKLDTLWEGDGAGGGFFYKKNLVKKFQHLVQSFFKKIVKYFI